MIGFPLRLVNNNCIQGYYLHYTDIKLLSNHQFYIPPKLDWLTKVHNDVTWLEYNKGHKVIKESITQERSPLCWIKDQNNRLQKVFIVWW